MRKSAAKIAINFVGALIFLTLAVAPARAQQIGDWCLFDRPRQLPFGADVSQLNDGRSPIEHTVALFQDMANIGPGWSINQCFSSRSAALALLATFAAGNIPANWCVIKCQTRPDAAGRPTPPRKSAILCKDFPWAPSLVSDGFSQIDENLTFTAAMAVVTAPEPGFVPGTPPGQCIGSMSFALGGSGGDGSLSNSSGGGQPSSGGGGNGGGREGVREGGGGGGGLPPFIMAPGPQNLDPEPPLNRPRPPMDQPQPPVKKASNDPDPKPPLPGSVAPPPMGQPPQNGPTTPQNPPPAASDPGFQSHFLSEPFTPGGQCPSIGAGQYTEKTAFKSCKWDDPKKPGGHNGWVGCVAERNTNFVCKASNAPQNCKCTQDWTGKVPPANQLAALAPGPDRAPWQTAAHMYVAPSAENPMGSLGPPPDGSNPGTKTAGLGPPPDESPGNRMGALGPPPDPPKNNPPAPGGTTAGLQPPPSYSPPIYIPIPGAPPNDSASTPANPCHPTPKPGNVCHPTPKPANPCNPQQASAGTGTKIIDKWDPTPKPPGDGSTGVMSGGSCDTKNGVTTCTDLQGHKCTSNSGFCNPALQASASPPPPSGPLSLKPKPVTQVASAPAANVCNSKTATSAVPACESKAPYLPWGGNGSASITVSGGKPCGIGWHNTGATILDSMSVVSRPAYGSLRAQDQHVIVFTPTPGFKGSDSFVLSMQEHNGSRRATLRVKVSVTIQ